MAIASLPSLKWRREFISLPRPRQDRRIMSENPKPAKYFAGYSGWSAGQLDAELETGSWLLTPAEKSVVFEDADNVEPRDHASDGGEVDRCGPHAGGSVGQLRVGYFGLGIQRRITSQHYPAAGPPPPGTTSKPLSAFRRPRRIAQATARTAATKLTCRQSHPDARIELERGRAAPVSMASQSPKPKTEMHSRR